MVMHSNMGHMCGHSLENVLAPNFQEPLLADGVELQQRRAELKPLRPLSPAARDVLALYRENGSSFLEIPGLLQAEYFACREIEQPLDPRAELLRCY